MQHKMTAELCCEREPLNKYKCLCLTVSLLTDVLSNLVYFTFHAWGQRPRTSFM